MKALISILIGIVLTVSAYAQPAKTTQFLTGPGTKALIRDQLQVDSLVFLPLRTDTNFLPGRAGAFVLRSADTLLYYYTGQRWKAVGTSSGGTTYTFTTGVTETGGVVKSDTFLMATRARVQKAIDSLGALNPNSPSPGGDSKSIQYDSSNSFSGNAYQFSWDYTNNRLGLGTSTPISQFSIVKNAIGAAYDTTSGILLANYTVAGSGAQQMTPMIRWKGSGWKTSGTAGTQSVEIMNYLLPVQGSTVPNYQLVWRGRINNQDSFNIMTISNTGLQVLGAAGTAGGLSMSSTPPVANTIYGTNKIAFRVNATPQAETYAMDASTGYQQTSGLTGVFAITNGSPSTGFFPSSGTANHYILSLQPSIHQTGSASGWSAGLYIRPIITSAADYSSIFVEYGKSRFMDQTIDQSILVQTTNATPTAIASIPLDTSGQEIEINVSVRAEFSTNKAFYTRLVRAKNVGGVVSIVGSPMTIGTDFEDAGIAAASITATVSGTDVIIEATGIAATNINWRSAYFTRYYQ